MVDRVSENDIHNVLDAFGTSPIGNESSKIGDVNFTDPLMVHFSSERDQRKKDNQYYSQTDGLVKDIDQSNSVWFAKSPSTFLLNDWHEMFDTEDYLQMLKEMSLSGKLKQTAFRGVCWKLYWDCLPENRENWISATKTLRNDYKTVRDRHLTDPYQSSAHVDLARNNPLSQEEDSPWHQYFLDEDLKQTIVQDLERLYPEMEFFRQDEIQNILLRCLFCYAKEHPHVGYKQGMHEILAPFVYVLYENSKSVQESKENLQLVIEVLHDEKYLEHDAYCLFSQIMETMEPLFINNKNQIEYHTDSLKKVADADSLFASSSADKQTSAISKKLNRIQNFMLKRYDHPLYLRLQQLDIAPQLYGIRWIRLLFGREYQLNSLLYLWDALFADGMSLDLADFVYVAMLINIRGYLMKNDYSSCLLHLMKYPSTTEARTILRRALAIKASRPQQNQMKYDKRQQQKKKERDRNATLRRQLSGTMTQEQRFAHVLGSSKPTQQNVTWYAKDESTSHKAIDASRNDGTEQHKSSGNTEKFRNEHKSSVGTKKIMKSPRSQAVKANMVAQISNAIGKHTAGISNEVMSKFASRGKQRSNNVSQLEEDHERLQKQVCQLQSELDRLQSLCLFCAGKMDSYIGFIDTDEMEEKSVNSNVKTSCVAGLKKVRDLLAGSIELEQNTESYERKFTMIDRSLSAAFNGNVDNCSNHETADSDDVITVEDENHFALSEPDSKSDSGFDKQNSSETNPDLDYVGYANNTEPDFLVESKSSQSLNDNVSDSSSTPTQEQWNYLEPIDSPGDFEKELLSIKNRFSELPHETSNRNDDNHTALEDLPMRASSLNSSNLDNDDSFNPSLEHFS